jgi:hypothetical protein
MAYGIQRVTIILFVAAHIDGILTEFTIISFAVTRPLIDYLSAVTEPITYVFMAGGIMLTWAACTLVHVNVTVATKGTAVGALKDRTFHLVLGDIVILTDTIRIPIHTRALVCVEGHLRLHRGFCACGAVGTWVTCTLVDIDIAVAGEQRYSVTLHHCALICELADIVILTLAIRKPSYTRASVRVKTDLQIII